MSILKTLVLGFISSLAAAAMVPFSMAFFDGREKHGSRLQYPSYQYH